MEEVTGNLRDKKDFETLVILLFISQTSESSPKLSNQNKQTT